MFRTMIIAVAAVLSAAAARAAEGEFEGVYIDLFETSAFEPCDSDEVWWLSPDREASKAFRDRREALEAEFLKQAGGSLASPLYYLMASGAISEKGAYGHMGSYDREFVVSSFSAFRLATNEERFACVRSGKFPRR